MIYSSDKLKYLYYPKDLEVISRYLEVIPVSFLEIAETSSKVMGLALRAQSRLRKSNFEANLAVTRPLLGAPPEK